MNKQLLMRLAGFAGIGVGVFILSFAVSNEIVGLFASEVLRGESGAGWVARISGNPKVALIATILPIIGFSLMLLVAVVLFKLTEHGHWASSLGIVGFLVGVPLAIDSFVSTTALIVGISETSVTAVGSLEMITSELRRFMLINSGFGPFLIIVVGNTSMSFAAWRTKTLPPWLGIWGLANGVIMTMGILSMFWPVLAIMQIGGPLNMFWFVATGVVLLRKSFTTI